MKFFNTLMTTAKPFSLALLASAKSHSETLRDFVARHPKHVTAVLAAVLLGGGGGAFAVANLGPDAANLPVRTLVETLSTPNLDAQVEALEQQTLKLYRNDITRGSDTAESLLRRLGLVDAAAAAYIRKTPEVRQALLNRSGRNVSVEANEQQQLLTLTTRWLKNDNDSQFQRMVITRDADNKFSVRTDTAPLTASVRMSGGTVNSSLYEASDEARLPETVTRQLADVFSGQIDFHRALRKGAVFSVVYETLEAEGEPLRAGRLLSAEITNDQKTYNAVWFQEPGQKGAYYTLKGDSLRRAFLASPVPYSRRTSGFGMREHPILHTQRAHLGVDYAAPTGTPVMSVADGVVVESGFQGAFGNMVVVQHNARQSTVYAHLSRMNVKRGQTIKQGDIVGAVGTTGLSTGPHLHFEFRINGRHVDPLTLAQQGSSEPISAAQRNQFNQRAEFARAQLMAAAQMRQNNVQ
ncbi:M23 family metallopeptidase [Limnohabitans sp. Hippo4]|uniref:M23 family metallopeptidase n=1 Tax=Limnohabitans sp. Hippo4 TaxID=1826167 RepID=UPI000DD2AE55|nr:M23 family metallopeptidase [Limnohabitans sp. Hippo4]PUE34157.1 peptidase M23 [Limnohabitans sp. Hippo4]